MLQLTPFESFLKSRRRKVRASPQIAAVQSFPVAQGPLIQKRRQVLASKFLRLFRIQRAQQDVRNSYRYANARSSIASISVTTTFSNTFLPAFSSTSSRRGGGASNLYANWTFEEIRCNCMAHMCLKIISYILRSSHVAAGTNLVLRTHWFTILYARVQDSAEFLSNMKDISPDLAITAAYGQFLPKSFLSIPKYAVSTNFYLPFWKSRFSCCCLSRHSNALIAPFALSPTH